jgi:hypothetical protein
MRKQSNGVTLPNNSLVKVVRNILEMRNNAVKDG